MCWSHMVQRRSKHKIQKLSIQSGIFQQNNESGSGKKLFDVYHITYSKEFMKGVLISNGSKKHKKT